MTITASKSGPFYSSGSISFSSLRNNFKQTISGEIKASELLRKTSTSITNPIVPDATENLSISESTNLKLSQFRNSIKYYNLIQSGTDLNIDLANPKNTNSTYSDWNSNLSKNINKILYINGTCGSTNPNLYAAQINSNICNLLINISGSILGAGGSPSVNSGKGGSALYVNSSGTSVSIDIKSSAKIYAGGGAGGKGGTGGAGGIGGFPYGRTGGAGGLGGAGSVGAVGEGYLQSAGIYGILGSSGSDGSPGDGVTGSGGRGGRGGRGGGGGYWGSPGGEGFPGDIGESGNQSTSGGYYYSDYDTQTFLASSGKSFYTTREAAICNTIVFPGLFTFPCNNGSFYNVTVPGFSYFGPIYGSGSLIFGSTAVYLNDSGGDSDYNDLIVYTPAYFGANPGGILFYGNIPGNPAPAIVNDSGQGGQPGVAIGGRNYSISLSSSTLTTVLGAYYTSEYFI